MTTIWEGCGWCPHLSGITTITSPSHPAGQIRKSEPVPGKGRVQLQSHSARAPQTELGRIELIFILQGAPNGGYAVSICGGPLKKISDFYLYF